MGKKRSLLGLYEWVWDMQLATNNECVESRLWILEWALINKIHKLKMSQLNIVNLIEVSYEICFIEVAFLIISL